MVLELLLASNTIIELNFLHNFYRLQRSWGKVMFLLASVILFTGGVPGPGGSASGGCLVPGGAWSRGGFCSRGGGAWSWGVSAPRGCLVETPRDGHCCRRYASYWNAFLSMITLLQTVTMATILTTKE